MTDKNKTGLNGQDLEQRITALEKEVADLKRQLEGQPEIKFNQREAIKEVVIGLLKQKSVSQVLRQSLGQ